MANEYFQPGSVPSPNSPGSSAIMRQEFSSIAAGFDKLPVLAGHSLEFISVDATGTRLIASGLVVDDIVMLDGIQTLTKKTIAWADNTFPGFDRFLTRDGVETVTNKTIAWSANTFPGFDTGATKKAGTLADNVLLLAENNKLPALDGSLLTNLNEASIGVVSIAHGGTGGTTLAEAQTNLGIDLKADAFDAVLTGAPTAPTPPTGDTSARIATTYFVTNTIQDIGSFAPSNATPKMDGVAASGIGALGSREDHVHPTDTSRAPLNSPTFTGVPSAPTAAAQTNTTQIATTAFVNAEIAADRPYSDTNPRMDGAAAQGTSPRVSRQDHVHPTDTSRAPLASPAFTGTPTAPTPTTQTNTTQIATTAFVQSLLAQQPPAGMQPSNSTPLINGTAAPGVGVEGSRWDHVHPTDTSRAPLASPAFTGNPTAPTPATADNDTSIATTAHVQANAALKVSKAGDTMTGPLIVNANTTTDAVRITQTGTGNALVVEDSTSPDGSPFVIDGSGTVLVGSTTSYGIGGPPLSVQSHGTGTNGFSATRWGGGALTQGPYLIFGKGRGGAVGTYGAVVSGDELGNIWFAGDNGTNMSNRAAEIRGYSDGTPSATSMPGRLSFYTTPDGSNTVVERMRIDNLGRIGFSTIASDVCVNLGGTVTAAGTGVHGYRARQTIPATATTQYTAFNSAPIATSGAAYGAINGYTVNGMASVGGSTIGTQFGFYASSDIIGGTANYGFYGNIPAGTGRWNFYANGTAANFFAGVTHQLGTHLKRYVDSGSDVSLALTATQCIGGIIHGNPAASIIWTLPTGADLDAQFNNLPAVDVGFEWSVINRAPTVNTISVATNVSGNTFLMGDPVVAANSSARYMTKRLGAASWVTYRIA